MIAIIIDVAFLLVLVLIVWLWWREEKHIMRYIREQKKHDKH